MIGGLHPVSHSGKEKGWGRERQFRQGKPRLGIISALSEGRGEVVFGEYGIGSRAYCFDS